MTTSVNLKTKKNKTNFDLSQLDIRIKQKGIWRYPYVAAVYYKGKRIRKYKESARFIYKIEDCIVKIEPEPEDSFLHQTNNEINFYKRLKKIDFIYFPKLIDYDKERGIVVQEFIQFKGERTKEIRSILAQIIEKYHIDGDICSYENYNWNVNAATGLPIIYDLGFC